MNPTLLLVLLLGLRHGISTENVTVLNSFIQSTRARMRVSLRYALNLGTGHALGMALVGIIVIKITPHEFSPWSLWVDRISSLWILSSSTFMLLDSWGCKTVNLTKFKSSLRSRSSSWVIGAVLGLSLGSGDILFFVLLGAHSLNPTQDMLFFFLFFTSMLVGVGVIAVGFSALHKPRTYDSNIAMKISLWVSRLSALASVVISVLLLLEAF